MKVPPLCFAIAIQFLLAEASITYSQDSREKTSCEFFERYDDWPEDLKIPGSILIADSHTALGDFFVSIAKQNQKIKDILLVGPYQDCQPILAGQALSQLSDAIDQVTWVKDLSLLPEPNPRSWLLICDSRLPSDISSEQWQKIADAMRSNLAQGRAVGFVGPAAVGLGKKYSKGDATTELENGVSVFPDALIDFNDNGQSNSEIIDSVLPKDRLVMLSIAKGNALLFQGRKAVLYGEGVATVTVPASDHLPIAQTEIKAIQRASRNAPESFLIDWPQWRRQAIERTLEPFPPVEKQVPNVPNGSLIIVGGGGMPRGLMRKFVQLAGGADARLVYIPCTEEENSSDTSLLEAWRELGVQTCSLLHTKDRRVADRDEAFLEPLKNATGIWFGGGRQWNLADSYYGTQAHRLMKQVLDRGGVIGGSSAGASIQANYLARATPIENFRIMAPGYERGGLGFISGVAIDQHFTQRSRQKDLRSLVETYPQMLGIGLDETTAIVVEKSTAQIVGAGSVTFNWKDSPEAEIQQFIGAQGQSFDLAQRVQIAAQDETSETKKP
jgi:cyanophycinase